MALSYFNKNWSKRYWIRHPIRWLRNKVQDLKDRYIRGKKGYCWTDVNNMDEYLLYLIPKMLRELAQDEIGGYPGMEPFTTPRDWELWLCELARKFEDLQETWAEVRNEYEAPYFNMLESKRIWVLNKDGNWVMKCEENEELEALREKWSTRASELNKMQQDATREAFAELAKYFYWLWS